MTAPLKQAAGLLVTGALALLLAGCGGARLADLDREFITLYQTKADYRAAADGIFLQPDSLSGAFADLSERAAARAQTVPANAPATQVAFWRLATLASWQAGERGEAGVIERARGGREACAALRAANQDAPRDCLLIELAEPLARQDATLRDMQALVRRLGDGPTLPASERPAFESFFGDFVARLGDLGALRIREFDRAPVPAAFWPRFDRQMTIVSCNASKARDYARRAGASMADLAAMFTRLESTARATGVKEPAVLFSAASCAELTNAFSAAGEGE